MADRGQGVHGPHGGGSHGPVRDGWRDTKDFEGSVPVDEGQFRGVERKVGGRVSTKDVRTSIVHSGWCLDTRLNLPRVGLWGLLWGAPSDIKGF